MRFTSVGVGVLYPFSLLKISNTVRISEDSKGCKRKTSKLMQENVLAVQHLQPLFLLTQPTDLSVTQAVLYYQGGMRSLQLPAETSPFILSQLLHYSRYNKLYS